MFRCAVLLTAVLLLGPARAGQYNKKVSIGDPAPTFTGLEGTDGKKHSLSDYKKDALVIAITCNECVASQAYEDRILAFAKKFAAHVDLVAISVSRAEDDKLPKMIERAKAKGYTFPYLHDPSQKTGRSLGATVTPSFFVFDKNRKLVYMGALDDSFNEPKVSYLELAVTATLKGDKVGTAETRPRGCGIVYE